MLFVKLRFSITLVKIIAEVAKKNAEVPLQGDKL